MFVPRFALGTVALLALFASVRGQEYCASDVIGDTSADPVTLPSEEVPPGTDFQVHLSTRVSPCPSGTHVGTRLEGCDNDFAPTVKLENLRFGTYHRNGNPNQTGKVTVTVFCRHGARAQAEQARAVVVNRQAQVSVARTWQ